MTRGSTFADISRELYLHPQPLEGGRGVASGESSCQTKKQPVWTAFLSLLLQAKPLLSKGGLDGLSIWSRTLPRNAPKKDSFCYPSCVERKTRVCPSALHSVYQAITFAQYYTPNSRDTWVVSRCRFRVRLLPYKLQNYSCLRQIYE